MSYKTLKKIIQKKLPNELLGLIEGQHFDAKSSPYFFNKDSAKHEFAKDVASFLNADGGYILLGGVTQFSPAHSGEVVFEIAWFPKELLSLQQYRSILNEWLYPEPTGIEFIIIEGAGEHFGKVICLIDIPKQDSANQPYLISKCLLEDGSKVDGHIIGYAKRLFDGTKRMEKKELHKWIKSGLSFEDSVVERLDYLSHLIEQRSAPAQTSDLIEEALPGRIESALAHLNALEQRVLSIAIYPYGVCSIPKIFESRRSPVASLMTQPPILRDSGWDVRCGLNPKMVEGRFFRSGESDRRVLDVYADGTEVFAALINEKLLAWGSKTGTRLHPLALAESIWGACALFSELAKHLDKAPEKVCFQLELRNLQANGIATTLPPHQVGSWTYHYSTNDHAAADNVCAIRDELLWSQYDPDVVAYLMLRAIYFRFDFTEDQIPYVRNKEGKQALDTSEMIKPVRG